LVLGCGVIGLGWFYVFSGRPLKILVFLTTFTLIVFLVLRLLYGKLVREGKVVIEDGVIELAGKSGEVNIVINDENNNNNKFSRESKSADKNADSGVESVQVGSPEKLSRRIAIKQLHPLAIVTKQMRLITHPLGKLQLYEFYLNNNTLCRRYICLSILAFSVELIAPEWGTPWNVLIILIIAGLHCVYLKLVRSLICDI
jgi:hypothetical protein